MFEASGRFTIRYVFVVASYFGDSGILSPSHPPTHSPASFCHLSLPAATADCSGVQVDQVLTPSVCICTWAVGWLMGGWPAIAHSPSRRFVTSSRPVRTPLVAGCRHKLSRSHFTTKGFALGHITHHTATSTCCHTDIQVITSAINTTSIIIIIISVFYVRLFLSLFPSLSLHLCV